MATYAGGITMMGVSIQVYETITGNGWISDDNRKVLNQPGNVSRTMSLLSSVPNWVSSINGKKAVISRELWEDYGRNRGFEKTRKYQDITLTVNASNIRECKVSQVIVNPHRGSDKHKQDVTSDIEIWIYNKSGKLIRHIPRFTTYYDAAEKYRVKRFEYTYSVNEPIGSIRVVGDYYGGHNKWHDVGDKGQPGAGWKPDAPIGGYANGNLNELPFDAGTRYTKIDRTILRITK